ncbi:MAG: DUF4091 domain-containing protein [Planctomycetes bacterium]|nr:DUF4091 domain-containing protein [Planctomycetota bacterium]
MPDGLLKPAILIFAAAAMLWGCDGRPVGTIPGIHPNPPQEPAPPPKPLDIWAAGEMAALAEETPKFEDNLVFDPSSNAVRLETCLNATACFQLVIDSPKDGPGELKLSWTDLTGQAGRIDKLKISALRMLAVRVERYPAWFIRLTESPTRPSAIYDALAPLENGESIKLKSEGRLAVWFDLAIPRDAAGGDYSAALTVNSPGRQDWQGRIDLKVHDVVLPEGGVFPAVGGFSHAQLFDGMARPGDKPLDLRRLDRRDPSGKRCIELVNNLMILARKHRLDLFDRSLHPILRRDQTGKVMLDWSDYDAVAEPFLSGKAFGDRLPVVVWPIPFSQDWPDPQVYGGIFDRDYQSTAIQVVADCSRHFQAKGWQERAIALPCATGVDAGAFLRHAVMARMVRSADRQTPILSLLPPDPPALTGWPIPDDLAGLADLYAPPAQWLDPTAADKYKSATEPLKGLWLSPGEPPYLPGLGVVGFPADPRVIPWFVMKYKLSGLFLPDVLRWQGPAAANRQGQPAGEKAEKFDPLTSPEGSQDRLFYPGWIAGRDDVLPSVRLKRLRRGMEDALFLRLLQIRRKTELASMACGLMARYACLAASGDNYLDARLDGWVRDARAWHEAGGLLIRQLFAAVHPETAAAKTIEDRFAMEWQAFVRPISTVRVEQVRGHIRPVLEQNGQTAYQATIDIELYSELDADADCKVALGQLPPAWEGLTGQVDVKPLRPGARRLVSLSAKGKGVPTTGSAKMPLPIGIAAGGMKIDLTASLPFLTAGQPKGPITIDGRLDEWPIRAGNTATDFVLVGKRGTATPPERRLAQRQTFVFVLADKDNIYIAMRCHEGDPEGMHWLTNNLIRYEQLMPCGEDVVEVLLDPDCAAAGPQDLFHVAVKPNGVMICEQGVSTSPPLGACKPWASGAKAAVARQQQAWAVELAIPRQAFGKKGAARTWGINFTRFAFQGQECSSWSGAPRYFYDPRNLGTILIKADNQP